jgi:hypothetical protein
MRDTSKRELGRYGLDWSGKLPEFFDIYFGEGMRALWHNGQSAVTWNGKAVDVPKLVGRKQRNKDESLFFIPAQRVLTLRDGWPRPFTDYSPGDPFAVREYSERLRTLVEKEFGANENLFPQDRRLKKEFRELLEQSVFAKFRLQVDNRACRSDWCWKHPADRCRTWCGRPGSASSCLCCWDCIG